MDSDHYGDLVGLRVEKWFVCMRSVRVTDLMMLELDGIGLIKKLKSQLVTRYIPIIMITVNNDLDSEVTAINTGADDYITRPVTAKRLLARVGKLIQRQTSNSSHGCSRWK
jgi:DNA-binding response OmpR family regulator